MSEDLRCCGTGTCIINAEGQCWCGQRWDGEKMCFPPPLALDSSALASLQPATTPIANAGSDPKS